MKMETVDYKKLWRGLVLILCYILIIPNCLIYIFSRFNIPIQDNSFYYILVNLLSYLISFIILLFIYWKDLKREFILYFSHFKENVKISLSTWFKALLFMFLANYTIIIFTGGIAPNESANRSIIETFPIFSCFTMIILGPFMEEMLFRKSFKDVFKSKTAFLIFTSFLFGFAHILASFDFSSFQNFCNAFVTNWKELLFIIPYGGIGYFFAKEYYETDTIFTSYMSHMFHNTFAVLISILTALLGA